MHRWSFLTNHALVLLCIAGDGHFRLRDIAERVGATERAAHRITSDLCEAGYLTRHRVGRRNYYEVHPEVPLRHPLERDHQLGDILAVLLSEELDNRKARELRAFREVAGAGFEPATFGL